MIRLKKKSKAISVLLVTAMLLTLWPGAAYGAGPAFTSAVMDSLLTDNYIRVVVHFSEGIYTDTADGLGTGAITKEDFTVSVASNGGTVTGATINLINYTGNSPPQPGNSDFYFFLNLTGGPPSGTETITISPVGGDSVYNGAGEAMEATASVEFTLLDKRVEFAAGYPQAGAAQAAGSKQVELVVKPLNETVTAYYVVVAYGAATPDAAQVMAGQDSAGRAALAADSDEADTDGDTNFTATLPEDATDYDAYVVIKDPAGNVAGPVKVEVRTPDASASSAVTGIAVRTQPTELTYSAGEALDLSGLVVTLTYSDEPTLEVDYEDFIYKGITADPDHGTVMVMETHHNQPVAVSCNGQTAYTDNLTVTAAPADNVCELGGTPYATLDAALAQVPGPAPVTIKLLQTIDYSGGIVIDNKNITFDLNGFTLNVTNPSGVGLSVANNGIVSYVDNTAAPGKFNVTGTTRGVYVSGGGQAVVTSAKADNSEGGIGAYVVDKGKIEIHGDAEGYFGVYIDGDGESILLSSVTVHGDAKGVLYGTYAHAGKIDVDGDSTSYMNNTNDCGAYAVSGGVITIAGDARGGDYGAMADGPDSRIEVGGNAEGTENDVGCGAAAVWGGSVEITGDATGKRCGVYAGENSSAAVGGSASGGTYGAQAGDTGAVITVMKDVTANGDDGIGVYAANGGSITVGTALEAANVEGVLYGAYAGRSSRNPDNISKVHIFGDAEATTNDEQNGFGAYVENDGEITIEGSVFGVNYLKFKTALTGDTLTTVRTRGEHEYTEDLAYRLYTDDVGKILIKEDTVPQPVCKIDGQEYLTLYGALKNVESGETITLLSDIGYAGGIDVSDKDITFDLNTHTVSVDNPSPSGAGLKVTNGGLALTGSGTLNVCGRSYGVHASSAAVDVTNAEAGENGIGVYAEGDSIVNIAGNVTAYGASGGGVSCINSEVTIDGSIAAERYIKIGEGWRNENAGSPDPAKPGYKKYSFPTEDETAVVWVREAAASTVTGIAVKTQPADLSYTEGESLDLDGLVVTLTYNDSSTLDVDYQDFSNMGITADPAHGTEMVVATHHGQPVAVSCNGQTANTNNLTVTAASQVVTGIAIKSQPSDLTYTEGESLDLDGLVVTLTYNDSSTLDVDYEDFSFKGITADPAHGTEMVVATHHGQPVTVSCNGQTANTNNLTVTAASQVVTGIAIKSQPSDLTYTEGESLDLDGLVVTLTYNDSSTLDVDYEDFSFKGITADPAHGTEMVVATHHGQPVTVSCNGQTANTDNLTVTDASAGNVCQIDGTPYATLDAALDAVPEQNADAVTIKLLSNITDDDGIDISRKKITLDLNGKTLTINNSAGSSGANSGIGLKIQLSSEINVTGGGNLNIASRMAGLSANESQFIVSEQTTISVTSAEGIGVHADTDCTIVINGNVTGAFSGIYASYGNNISVSGAVTTTGSGANHAVNINYPENTIYVGSAVVSSGTGAGVYIGENGSGSVTVGSPESLGQVVGKGHGIWTKMVVDPSTVTVYGDVEGAVNGINFTDDCDITIYGNVISTATAGDRYGVYGFVNSDASNIVVDGDVEGINGVYIHGAQSEVTVTGDVTASGASIDNNSGLRASYAKLYVGGNVTAANCTGAYSAEQSEITIDGTISAANYIKVKYENKAIGANDASSSKLGYLQYSGDDAAFVWVKEAAARTVTGIAVRTQPTKLTYSAGESLDLSGLVVTLTYSDETTLEVGYEDFIYMDITADPAHGTAMVVATHHNQPVAISCNGQTAYTDNLTVTAASQVVTGIAVRTQPTKLTYSAGETLDLSGLVVTLTYSDETTLEVGYEDFIYMGITADPAHGTAMVVATHHNQPVAVSCNGQTATTDNLTVTANRWVTGIAIKSQPTDLTYRAGETLDLSGLVVTLTYNDETTLEVGYEDFIYMDITADPAHGTAMVVATHHGQPVAVSCNGQTATTNNLTVTAASSGGGGGGGNLPPAGTLVTSSGSSNVSGNGVTLSFPAGAVESDIRVQIKEAGLSSGMTLPDDSQLLSRIVEIVKDKSGDFSQPVTITMAFDMSMADPDRYEIKICYFDEETGEWVELDSIEVNLDDGTVSGQVNHFTKFAVIATPKAMQPEPVIPPVEPGVQAPAAGEPPDISGHWARDSIVKLINAGVISGYPDGSFQPDNTVTRAEYTVMLVKALKLEPKDGPIFADTASHWAREAISGAAAHGLVSGYDQDTFGPDDLITREQAAVITVRAAGLAAAEEALTFTDAGRISPWALSGVAAAVSNGFLAGYPDNSFRPQEHTTRAEAAVIIARLL